MGTPSIARREPPNREQCIELLGDLPTMDEAARGAAVSALLRSSLSGIRERAVAIASATVKDAEVESFLRKGADDMLRNAGLEILKRRGRKGLSLAINLLDDPEARLLVTARDREQITEYIDAFAADNDMPACATPIDV